VLMAGVLEVWGGLGHRVKYGAGTQVLRRNGNIM